MNFYEHQERAEKKTALIVFLFCLAVLCIVAIVVVPIGFATAWDLQIVAVSLVVCVGIIGFATLYKQRQLRGGGSMVAEMLGGVPIPIHNKNTEEQRLQNIVEEMAIASGMPVPQIYILEDEQINAFAAGWSTDDVAIGVTRGCIEKLNRDELQGVIAHEFSHISHGDMRINIRLIGIIFGIMALGITGWVLARYVGPLVLRSSARSRSKEGAGGAGVGLGIIVIGLFLVVCGAVGTFFGRMIQAAVSRQREFLADASAVQFTRSSTGIGGALRKIGGVTELSHKTAETGQCNHMFFSQAMRAVFASHPPVTERIARVEGIDAQSLEASPVQPGGAETQQVSGFSSTRVSKVVKDGSGAAELPVASARSLIESIDLEIIAAISDPWSARLVIYALVAKGNSSSHTYLAKHLSLAEFTEYRALQTLLENSQTKLRLPIIDLAAPVLRQLSKEQKAEFDRTLVAITKSDGVVDFAEWVTVVVLRKHLFGGKKEVIRKRVPIAAIQKEVSLVLGFITRCGGLQGVQNMDVYTNGMRFLSMSRGVPNEDSCTAKIITQALRQIQCMSYRDRQRFMEACQICVTHDGVITESEGEAIRAIGDSIHCPIPLFQKE